MFASHDDDGDLIIHTFRILAAIGLLIAAFVGATRKFGPFRTKDLADTNFEDLGGNVDLTDMPIRVGDNPADDKIWVRTTPE